MSKKKRSNLRHEPNTVKHSSDHVGRDDFFAALSGEPNVWKAATETHNENHSQMPVTDDLSDSRKRKRDEIHTPPRDLSNTKRAKKTEFPGSSASETSAASVKISRGPKANRTLQDEETPSKVASRGMSINRFGPQALQSQTAFTYDLPSQPIPTAPLQLGNAHYSQSHPPAELKQSTTPRLFRSSKTGVASEVSAETPRTRTSMPIALQKQHGYQGNQILHGSENVGKTTQPGCLYAKEQNQQPVQTFVPNQHESRRVFQKRAKRQVNERTPDEIKARGGMFVPSEKEIVAAHCNAYQRQHEMNDYDFAEFIQSKSAETREFLGTVHQLLPYRKPSIVFDHMRRVFHNFKPRGQWTKEEDQKLSEAVDRLGRKWVAISQELNRHHEDCAERYKNYHLVKDQKLTNWDDDETEVLRSAVGNVLLTVVKKLIEDDGYQASKVNEETRLPEWEINESLASTLILWQSVAARVPRRSRLQCYMRWGLLRKNGVSSYVWELNRAMKREKLTQQIVNGVHVRPQGKAIDAPKGIRIYSYEDAQNLGKTVGHRKMKEMYGGDRLEMIQHLSDSRIKKDDNVDWDKVRRETKGLEIFADMMLAEEWEDIKAKYEDAKGEKSLLGVKTHKAAKKIIKWLRKNMTPADQLLRWSTRRLHRDKLKNQDVNTPNKPKSSLSSFYVDFEDRDDQSLEGSDAAVGIIDADYVETRELANDHDMTDEDDSEAVHKRAGNHRTMGERICDGGAGVYEDTTEETEA